jgi:hypothetical protein
MTTSTSKPLKCRNEQFYGAHEIGFNERGSFVLSLFNYPPPHDERGNYFTALPISPSEYRANHKTKCAYQDAGEALIIYDDWGKPYRIEADRDLLDALCSECSSQGLPLLNNPNPTNTP